jgi:hypothetical protein
VHEDVLDVGAFGAFAEATDLVVRTCRRKRAKEVSLTDHAEFVRGLAVGGALQLFDRRQEVLLLAEILSRLGGIFGTILMRFLDALLSCALIRSIPLGTSQSTIAMSWNASSSSSSWSNCKASTRFKYKDKGARPAG